MLTSIDKIGVKAMSETRNKQYYFQKAAMYDALAKYYKYSNPSMHIHYYQKHIHHLNKAVQMLRTETQEVMEGRIHGAAIRIIHAAPDTKSVDVYVNGTKISKDLPFRGVSEYISLPAGKYQVDIYPAGTMVSTLFSKKISVKNGHVYTLAASGTPEKLRLLEFEDRLGVHSGRTKLRFIHLSPDAPAVDIAFKNGDVIFPNISYKHTTNYLELTPMSIEAEVRVTGTKSVVLSLPMLELRPNEAYTVVALGFVEKEPKLEAIVIPH